MGHARTTHPDDDGSRDGLPHATRLWVEKVLGPRERVTDAVALHGGSTSTMRRLSVVGRGGERQLVLRSFAHPFFARHAVGLLSREAAVLRLLKDTDIPAAAVLAVDAAAEHCAHPSLLMTLLPGTVRLTDRGAGHRADLLARQLLGIHRTRVAPEARPRPYQPWAAPESVEIPPSTSRPRLWDRAVDVIRREPPDHVPRFLHRDFHPGNVLFTGDGDAPVVSGVVDWVETSWGPADLDVAHCCTNLALLHGVQEGMRFADRYTGAGGALADDPAAHLYWRLLDALSFAPDAGKIAGPWHDLGRTDLTPALLGRRLEDYLQACFERYGGTERSTP
ncbi:phosphotransferase family protein [Streptomyces sp. TR06-5]|uniref:phosphotransferase family protein n=1 Tax=Streptomyces sp. TR06-5 TaxID=3385976 RepID=UPI0039A20D3F